jgi:hypothetical protein
VPKARNILVPLIVWGEGRMAANEMVIHVSSARANRLDQLDSCAGEAEDGISAIEMSGGGARPIAVVMLTLGGVSGLTRPCRMELCRGKRIPPPVPLLTWRHMHHVLKRSAKRPIVDTYTSPSSRTFCF